MTSITSGIEAVLARVEPGARKAHKRQILAGALVCFDRDGLDAVTVETIRAHAESSVGSIYHHFGNKDGLVAALYFAGLDDQSARMRPRLEAARDAREAIEALVAAYLEWVCEQPMLARFMFRARGSVADGPHRDKLDERNRGRFGALLALLEQGVKSGQVRKLPRETYAPLLIGPSESYCRAWLAGRVKAPPVEYAAVFMEAAWLAVGAVAAPRPASRGK